MTDPAAAAMPPTVMPPAVAMADLLQLGATRRRDRSAPDPVRPDTRFGEILAALQVGGGVSDIHFLEGQPARIVRHGRLEPTNLEVTGDELALWADLFAARRGGAEELRRGPRGAVSAAAQVPLPDGTQTRLRLAFGRQLGGIGLTVRIVPMSPPRLASQLFQLNPPPQALADIALGRTEGLVLFCGATGSGKSTLQSALIAEVNHRMPRHIYTIEDPVEFVHEPAFPGSTITQREIGEHVDTFQHGLEAALRRRPDIILVGELLDLATVRVAIEAANKGHLVYATSHAATAEEAVSSIVGQFPGPEQEQVAVALSQAMRAVVVQRLLPTAPDQNGRTFVIPARELLLNTLPVAVAIRERRYREITGAMKVVDGMYRIEDDLQALWATGRISHDTALDAAVRKDAMRDLLHYAAAHREQVVARWTGTAMRQGVPE